MRFPAALFVLIASAGAAVAQPAPPGCPTLGSPGCVAIQPFQATGKATLAAGTATSNVALGTAGGLLTAVVSNAGTVDVWVSAGGSSVTATVGAGILVPAGGWGVVAPLGSATYLAAITGSSTAALTILTGTGVPTGNPIPGSSGGGGGGSVTQGTIPWADNIADFGGVTVNIGQQIKAASMPVVLASDETVPVTGTFWQATQPISAAALPLPTGAATAANQTAAQGTVGAGTAPANMVVDGGVYNSSPPAPTTGQSVALQLDSAGNLKVNLATGNNVGGFDSGPVQVSASVANSSHAAGTSLGGLFTIAVARTNGGSGGLSLIRYKSGNGSVGQVVLRLWEKNPTSAGGGTTVCTDNSAFVGNATDDAYQLMDPSAITPAAPAVTTGDAATRGSLLPGRISFVNSDTSPGKNLYACVVTVATDTADQNGLVYVTLSGDLN